MVRWYLTMAGATRLVTLGVETAAGCSLATACGMACYTDDASLVLVIKDY